MYTSPMKAGLVAGWIALVVICVCLAFYRINLPCSAYHGMKSETAVAAKCSPLCGCADDKQGCNCTILSGKASACKCDECSCGDGKSCCCKGEKK